MHSFLSRHRPSPAMLVALLALFAALAGGDAYAAATNFLLNTSNTTSAQTRLNGSAVAGKAALTLTNTNTASGSTAVNFNVASGHTPFNVSAGAGKVTGLNADKLDGLDANALASNAFVKVANFQFFLQPTPSTIAQLNLGAGSYVIEAKTNYDTLGSCSGSSTCDFVTFPQCTLSAGTDSDLAYQAAQAPGVENDRLATSMALLVTHTATGPFTASLSCLDGMYNDGQTHPGGQLTQTKLVAIKVGSLAVQ